MPKDTLKETALATVDLNIQLPSAKPEYKSMLANIAEKAPAIAQASSNFYKSHSQMMSVTLDVTAITPNRSIKHTLAEIEKTKSALQEGYFRMKRKRSSSRSWSASWVKRPMILSARCLKLRSTKSKPMLQALVDMLRPLFASSTSLPISMTT